MSCKDPRLVPDETGAWSVRYAQGGGGAGTAAERRPAASEEPLPFRA